MTSRKKWREIRAERLALGGVPCSACDAIGYTYKKNGRTEIMPDGSTFYFGHWIECRRCDASGLFVLKGQP